jgi:nitrite reductase (NADH) small subunit
MSWYRITCADNIPPREGRSVELGGIEIAIVNLGDRFAAVENRCPHKGGPLADGIVGGSVITCPLHNWRVCAESGRVVKPAEEGRCVRTFGVKVDNGIVMVELPEEEKAA